MPNDVLIRVALDESGATGGLDHVLGAFEKLEQRSASGAVGLRRVEFGLRTLAEQAVGTTGPLGRIIDGLLSLTGGSALVLGVAAGVATIGAAMYAMGTRARDAAADVKGVEDAMKKLNEEALKTAKGPIEQLFGTGKATGFWHLFFGGEEAGRGLLETQTAQTQQLTEYTQRLVQQWGSLANAPKDQKERFKELYDQLKATTDLIDVMRGKLDALHKEDQERHDKASRRARETADILAHPGRLILGENIGLPGGVPAFLPGAFLRGVPTDEFGKLRRGALFGAERKEPKIEPDEEERLGKNIGAGMAAALALAGGATRGGAAAISGLGGAASALAGITTGTDALGKAMQPLSFLGPVGTALAGLGGLISLFGGGQQMHVVIDGYDPRALTQQQQMLVALTGFKGLNIDILSAGGDVNSILARLGRAARTDGTIRVPPGG